VRKAVIKIQSPENTMTLISLPSHAIKSNCVTQVLNKGTTAGEDGERKLLLYPIMKIEFENYDMNTKLCYVFCVAVLLLHRPPVAPHSTILICVPRPYAHVENVQQFVLGLLKRNNSGKSIFCWSSSSSIGTKLMMLQEPLT
jgi:hypothetical protein